MKMKERNTALVVHMMCRHLSQQQQESRSSRRTTVTSNGRRRKRPSTRILLGVVLAFVAVFTSATDSFTPNQHHATTSSSPQQQQHHHQQQQRHYHNSPPLHASTVIPLPPLNNNAVPLHNTNRNSQQTQHLLSTTANTSHKKQQQGRPSKTTPITTTTTSTATDIWAERYCSVQGLRDAFGKNRNAWWGDLDGAMTRRLYKRLLPIILIELRDYGLYDATTLAPLAYKARLAAKLYARERSIIPARVMANCIDLVRHFAKYGEIGTTGMSYEQLFDKYAVLCQTQDEREVCTKILERSCVSNEYIDRLCGAVAATTTTATSSSSTDDDTINNNTRRRMIKWKELEDVSIQCEEDIKKLLQLSESLQNFRALRSLAKVKRRISSLQKALTNPRNNNKSSSSRQRQQQRRSSSYQHRRQ